MSKGYFAKEIDNAVHKLATGDGMLRERMREAFPDVASAYALKEPFFKKEFDEIEPIFELVAAKGFESLTDKELKKLAICVCEIASQSGEFLSTHKIAVT